MARPKKEKELKHHHQIMLRLTDIEYELFQPMHKMHSFHWLNMLENSL